MTQEHSPSSSRLHRVSYAALRGAPRFLSFRLNRPSGDESQVLLSVSDWERVTAREVPEREGRPIVGVDLGGGRAWSAAVAVWGNGRVECRAVAPGIPSLDEQERRDRQPQGTYTKLYDGHPGSCGRGERPSQSPTWLKSRGNDEASQTYAEGS